MGWRTDLEGRKTIGGARVVRLLREEVYTNASPLAEKLQEADPEGWSDATVNGTREEQVKRRIEKMPDAGDGLEEALAPRTELAKQLGVRLRRDSYLQTEDEAAADIADEEMLEAFEEDLLRGLRRNRDEVNVMEWWIVSGYLAEQLEQHAEVVVTYGEVTFRGREATGQNIALDGILQDIVAGAADEGEDLDAPLRPELSAAALSAWLREQVEKEQVEALEFGAKEQPAGKPFDVLRSLDLATGRRQGFELVLAHINGGK